MTIPLPIRQEFGLTRTTCACPDCTISCRFVPGMLVPSDLHRIWGESGRGLAFEDWAKANLLASPGALVWTPERGKFRIPTIVPARRPDGACKFLDESSRCTIHTVSPFGCAFFDSHQDHQAGAEGSGLGIRAIAQDHADKGPYHKAWLLLHQAGLRAPSPDECRKRMSDALAHKEHP